MELGTEIVAEERGLTTLEGKRQAVAILMAKAGGSKPDFARILASFLLNFKSPNTIKTYALAVGDFFAFLAPHIEESLKELRRHHVIEYKAFLTARGLANKSIHTHLAAVSSLAGFLAREGLIDHDITFGLRFPKGTLKKETAALSADDVKKVFASLPKNKWFTAHRAMLAVGFYTGLRSSEIRHLKVGDYGAIDGHRVLNLLAKGDVRHEVPITPFVVRCLDEHLEGIRALGLGLTPGDYLFPRLHPHPVNEPISQVALRNLFLRKLGAAAINQSPLRRYCPHSMRATLATHLLTQADVPLEDVARLLGHRNPTTTKTYIKEEKHHDKSPVYKISY